MENRFNLIEEDWIPVADRGKVSLMNIFTDPSLKSLGGNPIQKISVIKLLLAIAQSVFTPIDDEEWASTGPKMLAGKCRKYLEENKDCFWLYGDKPFLQMTDINEAGKQSFGALLPEISTGNTTVLFNSQIDNELNDSEKALVLLQISGFALAGKKVDNSVVLSSGYQGKANAKGKPSSGKAGPSLGFLGYQHQFYLGNNLQDLVFLNLFTHKDIEDMGFFPNRIGIAPWINMPTGEDDHIAQKLKKSYMGRLLPLSRFSLIEDNKLHYSEGIAHQKHNDGLWDPSIAVIFDVKQPKAIWVRPEKRPWRTLPSLLSFIQKEKDFLCFQLKMGFERNRRKYEEFGIWSGGVKVSSNAGEQYCSGSDDYVESSIFLRSEILGDIWYLNFKEEMERLNDISSILFICIKKYQKEQKIDNSSLLEKAQSEFWQLCETQTDSIINSWDSDEKKLQIRKKFSSYVHQIYNKFCPSDTARQMASWAEFRPNLSKYILEAKKEVN